MKTQAGFTLIELFAVLVVLALLGAMAVPRFTDGPSDNPITAKASSRIAVKTAHALYIAKNKSLPDVNSLASWVTVDGEVTGVTTGIKVAVDGLNYLVPTYTDTDCISPTSDIKHTVRCIGNTSRWP